MALSLPELTEMCVCVYVCVCLCVCVQGADNMHLSARSLCGILMRPASSDRNVLCSFVASVQAIMEWSESNTEAMLQKVLCVNCPCCYLSSVKTRCVSAINCWKIKIRTFLTGKFVQNLLLSQGHSLKDSGQNS